MRIFEENELEELAEFLRDDEAAAVPTDTVYGVCARMDHPRAQENLRDVKHRPAAKAFPLMCCDAAQIRSVCETDERAEKLIAAFMPGPVTLVLKKKAHVPEFVNGGMDTLAVRMASSEALEELIRLVGVPLYMTSANRSGEEVCASPEEIEKACPGLCGILTGRPQFKEASTIIDCTGQKIRILREGPVTMEQITHVLGGKQHA